MGWGGQEIRILQESLGMMKRGHRVVIAAPARSSIFKRADEAGISVLPAYFQKHNPFSIVSTASIINRVKPDIVNTHSSSDSWVSALAVKLSGHGAGIIRTRHLSTPISKSFTSRLIYEKLPDSVMTTGEQIRQNMIHDNGFSASKIISIPTGIDLERFNPEKVEPAFRSNNFSVGMVGVLRSWKGHVYFLEAINKIKNKIPEMSFYIAGDGPQHENIEGLISKLSLNDMVFMLGHREDVPGILASLDVVVHPSYANEGVPQSILQAFAMEKPVIASDTGAIKEVLIDGKTGLLIEPKNADALAGKIIELYYKPEMRAGFGKEGRLIVENDYSMGSMLDKIEALYEKILNDV
ncbi:MAG: glycosyltransferase family 1 protein [Nitrospiraceae bacterium]|nr:MAG: glycosyltransferase family 1 protein [Nitrospiraceae bacterium]